MRFAREQGIPAQGRGSAAGSIVAYTLGISRVEPIQHNLLFERFINEGRTTYPDVDIDFQLARREEVIQYVYDRYGPEHTGMVCNLVTYRARSAVREVGYALGFPRPLVDRVAKALETYDSVMVRRDLEADGGFAEFFQRPGEGLPAEAAAAAEAEERGLVDGMGQLNTRVPLVGKVPPWRQPPTAGRSATRRGRSAWHRRRGDPLRLPPRTVPPGRPGRDPDGPARGLGRHRLATVECGRVGVRATTRVGRATRRRASPGCGPAAARATRRTRAARAAGLDRGPGRSIRRAARSSRRRAAVEHREPRTGWAGRRAGTRPAPRPRPSAEAAAAAARPQLGRPRRARAAPAGPRRLDGRPLPLGALARVLRPHRWLPAPPLDPFAAACS